MEQKDIMKIIMGLIAVFIVYSFNSVLHLNIELYNILNISLFIVIALLIAIWLFEKVTKPLFLDCLILGFLLLSGISIKEKPKLFLFLFILFTLQAIADLFFKKGQERKSIYQIALPILSALVSLACFVFFMIGFKKIYNLLGGACILLILQSIYIIMMALKKNPDLSVEAANEE